jgi:hypothetical protein
MAYRESKADAQRKWSSANSASWKEYRARHPDYVKRNREKQRERNRKRPRKREIQASEVIAKMDALSPQNIIPFGRYRLVPLATGYSDHVAHLFRACRPPAKARERWTG